MRKKTTAIVSLFCLSCLAILLLQIKFGESVYRSNHFTRNFLPASTSIVKTIDISLNSYYLSGVTSSNIYLGNITTPLSIYILTNKLLKCEMLTIQETNQKPIYSSQIIVDSPFIYLTDQINGKILKGKLSDMKITTTVFNTPFFDAAVPINDNSYVLRALNNQNHEYLLEKGNNQAKFTAAPTNLLEKQVDGIFCKDGMLHYASKINMLIYVYFYRNQYLCIDTNLHLAYKGNTIDTNTTAKISVSNIKSENLITLSTPPIMVNRKSCIRNSELFINSALKADNESIRTFYSSSVIDVYDLNKKKYKYSFRIPNYRDNKIKYFKVVDNKIVTISGHYLVIYELNSPENFKL